MIINNNLRAIPSEADCVLKEKERLMRLGCNVSGGVGGVGGVGRDDVNYHFFWSVSGRCLITLCSVLPL